MFIVSEYFFIDPGWRFNYALPVTARRGVECLDAIRGAAGDRLDGQQRIDAADRRNIEPSQTQRLRMSQLVGVRISGRAIGCANPFSTLDGRKRFAAAPRKLAVRQMNCGKCAAWTRLKVAMRHFGSHRRQQRRPAQRPLESDCRRHRAHFGGHGRALSIPSLSAIQVTIF